MKMNYYKKLLKNVFVLQTTFAKGVGFLFILCTNLLVVAQQEPVFSLNESNRGYFNPGATAIADKYLVHAQYRNQWMKFGAGNPQTYLFQYEMDINRINSGIGIVAMRDEMGFSINHKIGLNYRYTFALGKEASLSPGLGVLWYKRGLSKEFVVPQTVNDPYVQFESSTVSVNFGLYFQWRKLNVGVGGQHLNTLFKKGRGFYTNLIADYTFDLGDKFSLIPTAFLLTDWVKTSVFVAVKGMHFNRFWWQAGYRFSGRTLSAGAGVQVWNRLFIGAAYEYSLYDMLSSVRHTIEATLSFRIQKPGKVKSPPVSGETNGL